MFCKYKDLFGKVREGAHSIRLFDVAVVDIASTVVAAGIVSYFLNKSFWAVLIVLFLLGVFFHYIFCVNTKINTLIFGNVY